MIHSKTSEEWDSPFYKPKNKICDEAWDEFMHAAKILLILNTNKTRQERDSPRYREPDIYSVFNKLRQDIHNELPYSKNFIASIDRSVEREFARERKSRRRIGDLPSRG